MDNDSVNALLTLLQDIRITRYAQLSSCFIVIFDHLITLDDEVSLIWKSSFSVGTILFLTNRYFALGSVIFDIYALFLENITDDFCLHMFQWQGWSGLIASMLAEVILQIRIYALYSLNKKLLATMLILFSACSACSAWIIVTEISESSIAVAPTLPVNDRFCLPLRLPRGIFRYWIPMLSFECLLCILAVFQGFRRFRSDGSMFSSGLRLARSLVKDSVFYFIVIFVTYLTCLLVWATARRSIIEVPIGFSFTMSCVLANRVVLNVRKLSKNLQTTWIHVNSRITVEDEVFHDPGTRFYTPGTLSPDDMVELRTMRADKK